jgi:hypothetical protein
MPRMIQGAHAKIYPQNKETSRALILDYQPRRSFPTAAGTPAYETRCGALTGYKLRRVYTLSRIFWVADRGNFRDDGRRFGYAHTILSRDGVRHPRSYPFDAILGGKRSTLFARASVREARAVPRGPCPSVCSSRVGWGNAASPWGPPASIRTRRHPRSARGKLTRQDSQRNTIPSVRGENKSRIESTLLRFPTP